MTPFCNRLSSSPFIKKPLCGLASFGFGLLTVERLLNVVNLANEALKCHYPCNACQMPMVELIKNTGTAAACLYTSFKIAQNMLAKPPDPQKHYPLREIVAFDPGEYERKKVE